MNMNECNVIRTGDSFQHARAGGSADQEVDMVTQTTH